MIRVIIPRQIPGAFRGPKAAFLGTAIDAPKKNIDVFVDEAFWRWGCMTFWGLMVI